MNVLMLFVLGCCGMWQKAETITLGKSLLIGPSGALLGSFLSFNCTLDTIPGNVSILYQLFLEGREKAIGDYSAHSGENGHINIYIQKKFNYDGRLRCKASGQNNTEITPSFSEWHRFRVLEPVTDAQITSNLSNLWKGDSVTLQCNISKGNYVLYNWQRNGKPVRFHYNSSQNTLHIPNLSNQDNGKYTCTASNEIDGLMVSNSSASVTITIKESPSEPEISVEIVKNKDGTFSSHVKCWVLRGSKPIIFTLNNNINNKIIVLAEERSDYMNASFLVPITLDENMSTVQCQADNGKKMRSKPVNLTVVLNKVPTEVAAIVFTCFSLMVLAVFSCCIYGVLLRKRESKKYMYRVGDHLTDDAGEEDYEIEMDDYDDEPYDMDEFAFKEDMDVVNASRITEPDQSEEDESELDLGIDNFY